MRLPVALLLLALVALPAQALERQVLRVGVAARDPPFSFADFDGSLHGFNVDIAQALCDRLQIRCTYVPLGLGDPVERLQNRQVDLLVASLAITEARRRVVDFTTPYYRAPSRFIAAKGAIVDPSPEAMAGRTIGVHRGTVQDGYVTALYAAGSTIQRYSYKEDLFIDLALGRLDAVLVDTPAGAAAFLATDLGAGYEFVGPELDDAKWFGDGRGIAVRKGDDELLGALDDALKTLEADGSYESIRSEYFPEPFAN
jgi:arginine/ornithine transport system substrate-binding protein